jgi:branched-chain amino acid transport system ATP-binding protein
LVEQEIEAALSISARAYVLESGRVVLQGQSREMLDREEVKAIYLGKKAARS